MTDLEVDAAVVGGGHHGLVAAAVLADAGWDVCLLEATDHLGGAVRSAELHPGYVTDLFSAFYPLSRASPVLQSLDLEEHGLRWSEAPAVLAHPLGPDGAEAAVLCRDRADTAAGLDAQHRGDGEAWLDLCRRWDVLREPFLRTLFTTFPPVRGPVQLVRRLGTAEALRLARFLLLPAKRMGEELFGGEGARLLLAGNAVHADIPTTSPVSGAYGWLLAMLGQHYGFPVPVGGAGQLASALARRAEAAGAVLRTGERVEHVAVSGGRVRAVHTAAGTTVRVRRAVVADVAAPTLYRDLLPADAVPTRVHRDLDRFVWDTPVVKLDWAIDGPIPWRAPEVGRAGTVHVGQGEDGLVRWSAELESRSLPASPFLLVGQMTTADPSRSPAGTESAWAYTHLPRGVDDAGSADELARRAERVLERFAPGFGARVRHRVVQRPSDLQDADPNLVHGTINGGTAQLFQQLVFRPVPGLGRPETPVAGLYLGSSSAHPGGGVHGACGWFAARAALGAHGVTGLLRRAATSAAIELLQRSRRGDERVSG
ncbi:NAD(P)/FAD-dependent oxidoreductase [Pseudonocardia kujensis]|uniref:phytoene desaturase family protein n=1 Tax=Pseudonocardia kujensis TaxID=1128675 RepID=UPI001E647975|nr:NAD(P)/FAD-dependent oxidoreductase [Pseudonocardia kujensis]MCE0767120.1 NAD(P)/FAD-dependent oxidoreductase [Pseudonocardia kujensis]